MVEYEPCELFGGVSGKAVVASLLALAFASYVGSFYFKKHYRTEARPWNVFWLDLLKMGMGQGFAYGVNVLNAHRNTGESGFNPTSWYFPTFLNDELIAVPLGVGLWHQGVLRAVRSYGGTEPQPGEHIVVSALRDSGKYYEGMGSASLASEFWSDPRVKMSWWSIQCAFWVCCVITSRLLGGLVVPACAALLGESSPYYLLAEWIYYLPISCAAKRWTFAGVFRVLIDLLQLAVVDFFNKFKAQGETDPLLRPATQMPSREYIEQERVRLPTADRARAPWVG